MGGRMVDYRDLGTDHFSHNDKTKSVNRLLRKIENLGFEVTGIRENRPRDPTHLNEVSS
jgi:hypothetical protein